MEAHIGLYVRAEIVPVSVVAVAQGGIEMTGEREMPYEFRLVHRHTSSPSNPNEHRERRRNTPTWDGKFIRHFPWTMTSSRNDRRYLPQRSTCWPSS
jgi:hypothetical protein